MSDDALRYDLMVENALRGVVRQALALTAERGLPGNHHFYITFRTDHPGVTLADHLRQRYPREMTIVLQLQFWGLKVEDEAFEVTLSFSDKPERLHIPFAAITAFADPSVRFGLQFEAAREAVEEEEELPQSAGGSAGGGAAGGAGGGAGEAPGEEAVRPKGTALAPVEPETAEETPRKEEAPALPAAGEGKAAAGKKPRKAATGEPGEVVSLDAFRKK